MWRTLTLYYCFGHCRYCGPVVVAAAVVVAVAERPDAGAEPAVGPAAADGAD